MRKNCIRTNTYYCGGSSNKKSPYLEISLFPFMDIEKPKGRKKKEAVTAPKQKNLNNKRSKRYFGQLVKSNFGEGDLHLTLTYDNKFLPDTEEAAEAEARNYIRRLQRARRKKGLDPLKYLLVTEKGVKSKRIHHHLIINGGLDRDEMELLWSRPKKKGEKRGKPLGWANADRIRLDDNGIEALAEYLSKDPQGRKRWNQSQNLKKPMVSKNDTKTRKKDFMKLVEMPEDCEAVQQYFESQQPGYRVTSVNKEYNAVAGTWSFYVKMCLRI